MTVETTQNTVTVTIDGFEIRVPKGTLVIRAAEMLGIQIPRFCDHPLLDPAGACRQCLVEVEGQRKPVASCTQTVAEGMVVRTQLTSPVAKKAQEGVMELLLMNHPLDCPMCDKGGECPLQNHAMTNGQGETRFTDEKRHFAKPVAISAQILLDRERCISCTRCVRVSEEIAGEPFIDFDERGPAQYIATAAGRPFNSYFSGNTVQICPVGALTGASYRFRARPYDLVSTPSVCEHCAAGCRQRTDHRRGAVTRRLAGNDPAVNEEWNCDKGRWAFTYATQPDRLDSPLVRDAAGVLRPASWPEAIAAAARTGQARRRRADRLRPRGRAEHALVIAHQGGGQPVRLGGVGERPPSLVAVPLLVHLRIVAGQAAGDHAAPVVGALAAAGRAVLADAGRGHQVERPRTEPVGGPGQRPDRADLHGVAGEVRVERHPIGGRDPLVRAAPEELDERVTGDLLGEPGASGAGDAPFAV